LNNRLLYFKNEKVYFGRLYNKKGDWKHYNQVMGSFYLNDICYKLDKTNHKYDGINDELNHNNDLITHP